MTVGKVGRACDRKDFVFVDNEYKGTMSASSAWRRRLSVVACVVSLALTLSLVHCSSSIECASSNFRGGVCSRSSVIAAAADDDDVNGDDVDVVSDVGCRHVAVLDGRDAATVVVDVDVGHH